MDDGPVLSVTKVEDDAKMAIHNLGAFQLLEYQSDVQRCRFDLYKPSSLFPTSYSRHKCTGDVELGLKPVVTTMVSPTLSRVIPMKYHNMILYNI